MRSAHAPAVGGGVVVVAAGLLLPVLLTDPVWLDVAVITLVQYCAALGLIVLFGYAGQISLAQAAFYGIGAYTTAVITVHLELSPWLGLPAGILLAVLVALAVGGPVLRLQGLYLAMATAALNIIFVVVVTTWRSVTGGGFGLAGVPPITIDGREIYDPRDFYLLALFLALLLTVLTRRLVRSPVGLVFAAIGHDQRAAALLGVPVPSVKLRAFMLSACYAATGGWLLAQYQSVAVPDSFSVPKSIAFLLMVVIGGLRSPAGALIGALFVTVVPQLLPQSPQLQEVLYAATFMVVLMFLPKGLWGGVTSALGRLRTRHAAPERVSIT